MRRGEGEDIIVCFLGCTSFLAAVRPLKWVPPRNKFSSLNPLNAKKDVPGFYVNRCLGPVLVEASALVKEGVPLEKMDKAMKSFGMPVGPITLMDEVGIDVGSKVASYLSGADLGVRMTGGDISLMSTMVEKGWLGKKSGKGFYTYKGKKGKTIGPEMRSFLSEFTGGATSDLAEADIQDRITARLVNEAAKCLEDGIIADPVAGDIGLVFGIGFAPFRGGMFVLPSRLIQDAVNCLIIFLRALRAVPIPGRRRRVVVRR